MDCLASCHYGWQILERCWWCGATTVSSSGTTRRRAPMTCGRVGLSLPFCYRSSRRLILLLAVRRGAFAAGADTTGHWCRRRRRPLSWAAGVCRWSCNRRRNSGAALHHVLDVAVALKSESQVQPWIQRRHAAAAHTAGRGMQVKLEKQGDQEDCPVVLHYVLHVAQKSAFRFVPAALRYFYPLPSQTHSCSRFRAQVDV